MNFDLEKRSKVVNLCPWTISFTLPNSKGEITLGANKSTTINNGELVTLADNGSVMFCGTGEGAHARVYVDNPAYREYVGFDNSEEKRNQFVLTDEECKKILELKTDSTFEKHVKEKVVFQHEKAIIMEYCRKNKYDVYSRISFLEEYTGEKYRKD